MPPFERLLAEARREAEPKTGRSEGRSPALQEAEREREVEVESRLRRNASAEGKGGQESCRE